MAVLPTRLAVRLFVENVPDAGVEPVYTMDPEPVFLVNVGTMVTPDERLDAETFINGVLGYHVPRGSPPVADVGNCATAISGPGPDGVLDDVLLLLQDIAKTRAATATATGTSVRRRKKLVFITFSSW
jgi:hypothetical protein